MRLSSKIQQLFYRAKSGIHSHWRLKAMEDNRFLIVFICICVGILASCTSVAMHDIGNIFEELSYALDCNFGPAKKYILPLIPGIAIFAIIIFGRLFFRKKGYRCSLTEAVAATRNRSKNIPFYHTFCHILTCGLSVGCGISAGMEAPSALTGAAIGSNTGRFLRLNQETRTLLMAAGAAAGIAAIFDSPMAGVLFACEILLPKVSAVSLIPLLIASASATITSSILKGDINIPNIHLSWNISQLIFYSFLGILAGGMSIFVIKVNLAVHDICKKITSIWLKAALGAIIMYCFFFCFPSLKGNGFEHIHTLLSANPAEIPVRAFSHLRDFDPVLGFACAIGLLALLKPIISCISLESGGDGGIFGPSLFIGGFLGFFFSQVLAVSGVANLPTANCIALGMAGLIAGVMHAPLTGLFLIAEMLGSYEMLIPLMMVVAISSFVCKVITKHNIYMSFITHDQPTNRESTSTDELNRLPVRDFTEMDYYPLRPSDDLHQLLQMIVSFRKDIFPVLDNDGKLLGIVKEEHIRPFILNAQFRYKFIVEDFMGTVSNVISADATLREATRIFDANHSWYLPVVDCDGRFLGFISKASLINNYRQFMADEQLF